MQSLAPDGTVYPTLCHHWNKAGAELSHNEASARVLAAAIDTAPTALMASALLELADELALLQRHYDHVASARAYLETNEQEYKQQARENLSSEGRTRAQAIASTYSDALRVLEF